MHSLCHCITCSDLCYCLVSAEESVRCFNFLFPRVVKYPPLCIFFCPRKLLRPQNHRDLKEYISLTQLPCPSFVKIRLLASWNLNRFVCKDICFCIWSLACPSLSLNICIHGLLWPLSRIAFPQLLPLT